MPTTVPASMVDADVATQAELDAAVAVKRTGDQVQMVYTINGAVSTGATAIPRDDTIPQITEGTEFLTRAITPTSAANIIEIEAVLHLSCAAVGDVIVALFQDATANALAVASQYASTAGGVMCVALRHTMVAGTTSSTTFRLRAGSGSGTVTFNGAAGARYFGGTYASSITVREIKA